ncbi:hypothetical protein PFISCL1PPCAC_5423, partial [Pristionchus fissidentatus]
VEITRQPTRKRRETTPCFIASSNAPDTSCCSPRVIWSGGFCRVRLRPIDGKRGEKDGHSSSLDSNQVWMRPALSRSEDSLRSFSDAFAPSFAGFSRISALFRLPSDSASLLNSCSNRPPRVSSDTEVHQGPASPKLGDQLPRAESEHVVRDERPNCDGFPPAAIDSTSRPPHL